MVAPIAVFRCDASPAIGAGHVTRCLALAEELERSGWHVVFATGAETLATVPALVAAGFDTELADGDERNDLARRFASGADLLVVDHYGRDASFERACRSWASRVLVFDDATGRDHDCDILIDSAAADPSIYAGHLPARSQALTGPAYALVRRAFLGRRKAALARRDGRAVGNILLSFGATDPWNATTSVLDALGEIVDDTTIAMSSRAPHLDEVKRRLRGRMRLVLDADNMAGLMTEADLAIGAAGATSYERAVLGLPTILLTLAENQRGLANLLLSAGAAVDGGEINSGSNERLRYAVLGLVEGSAARIRMAEAAGRLVDGQGVRRIAEYVASVKCTGRT